ncbi:TonB-dependent siderophore receptor [Azoarcus sp. DN11]|uniref:TonB-dependent receptor n=1 Tax=Azoarcus sp. DN11 TaxID=356837 RepID=UPI000EB186D9|nr:TonB-dependent siderophore receptor [Azoarcus sp. DN11]AYH45663.1 hypothetical protein CDA09_20145 [Azoarcus sp. DN11]
MQKHRSSPVRRIPFALRPLAASLVLALSGGLAHADDKVLTAVQVSARAEPDAGLDLDRPGATGSRLGLSLRETPASVDALDVETLRERGDRSVADAATRAVGLSFIGTPGSGQAYSSRGFTGNNSVAQAEDGLRLATGAGTLTYPSDTWGYERIEILRGPASVLFGDGAVGGILNLVRKAPTRGRHLDASLTAGSRGEYHIGVGGSTAVGDAAALRLDAAVAGGDGFIHRGEHDNRNLMSTLHLAPRADLQIDLSADLSRENPTAYFGTPLRNGRIARDLRHENYNIDDPRYALDDDRLRARIEWQAGGGWTLRNETYRFAADRHWRNVEQYALDSATNAVTRTGYLEILHRLEQAGNRLELAHEGTLGGMRNRFDVGWEFMRVDFRHTNNSPYRGKSVVPARDFEPGRFDSPDPTRPKFDTETRQQAVFVEDALRVGETLTLVAGLRHDRIAVARDELVSGQDFDKRFNANAVRLGAVHALTPATSLYAQASTGSDPVTSLVSLNLANRNFDLTHARQTEAGVKQSLDALHGEWTAAAFHIRKDDIVTRDPANPGISVQGGTQSSRGIEITASIEPVRTWRIDANATVLDARFDELVEAGGASRAGNTPANVPERLANLWVSHVGAGWDAGIGARYVGKRYGDNANTLRLDAYTVLDATLGWHLDPRTALRLNLRNLTDRLYATAAYGSTQVLLGAPRSVELTADLRF